MAENAKHVTKDGGLAPIFVLEFPLHKHHSKGFFPEPPRSLKLPTRSKSQNGLI